MQETKAKHILPDIAVRSAVLLNTSVIPRPFKISFRSISCSIVNLVKIYKKDEIIFFICGEKTPDFIQKKPNSGSLALRNTFL